MPVRRTALVFIAVAALTAAAGAAMVAGQVPVQDCITGGGGA